MLLSNSLLLLSALPFFTRAASIGSLSDEMLLKVLEKDEYESATALACTNKFFHEFVSSEALNQILAYASSIEHHFSPAILSRMVLPAFSFLSHPDSDAELVRSALAPVITSWYQLNDQKPIKMLEFPESIKTKVINSNWDKPDQIGYISLALSGYEGFSLVFDDFFFNIDSTRHDTTEKSRFMKSIFNSHRSFFERKEKELYDLVALVNPNRAHSDDASKFVWKRFKKLTGHFSAGNCQIPPLDDFKMKLKESNFDHLWKLIFMYLMDEMYEGIENFKMFLIISWQYIDADISDELSNICQFFSQIQARQPFKIPADWSAERLNAFSSFLRIIYRNQPNFSLSFVQKMLAANDEPSTKLLHDMLQDPNFEKACIGQVQKLLLSLQDDQCIFHRWSVAGHPQIYSEVTINGFNLIQQLHPDFLVDFVVKDLIKIINGNDAFAAKYESILGDCGHIPVIQMAMQTNDTLIQNRDLLIQKLPKITSKIF